MRLRRILRTTNWKYALGEIAIVAIGVLLALRVSNWDQSRKARAVEIETLRELNQALAADAEGIGQYIRLFQVSESNAEVLLAHMEQDLPYHDSLQAHFGGLMRGTVFSTNAAPYETLKSRGLQTITNDSLRLEIANLYDVTYEHLQAQDRISLRLWEDKIQPQMIRHFRNFHQLGEALPRQPESILDNPEFRGTLEMLLFYRVVLLPQYERAADRILHLRNAIEREIARLG